MIIILGYDSLEYDRAVNFSPLKQTAYGKMDNFVGYDREITPVLWSTIIIGEMPNIHGVTWRGGEDLNAGLRKRIQCPTIFDDIPGSIAICVPNVTMKYYDVRRLKSLWNAQNRALFLEYKTELIEEMDKIFKRLASHLKSRKSPMVMAYFGAPDTIGHIFPNQEDEPIHAEIYKYLADKTKEVKALCKKQDTIIIVSDHGMKKGTHTKYAWISANKPIKLPDHITGFKKMIMDIYEEESNGRK